MYVGSLRYGLERVSLNKSTMNITCQRHNLFHAQASDLFATYGAIYKFVLIEVHEWLI